MVILLVPQLRKPPSHHTSEREEAICIIALVYNHDEASGCKY